jgi:hypothetical protein
LPFGLWPENGVAQGPETAQRSQAPGYGKDDNEGLPMNPYNLRAEWGPSSFGDIRHRAVLGTGIPLPGKLR